MNDATKDRSRVTPRGRAMGEQLVRKIKPVIEHLVDAGEPDERCKSCAFRAGTVPNGCLQTQLDALKAVLEQTPFACHAAHHKDGTPKLCAGWLASQWGAIDKPVVPCPWDFSPPDEVATQ